MHLVWIVMLMLLSRGTNAAETVIEEHRLPAFTLPTLEADRFVSLVQQRGHVVIVNFWHSECPPCVREMPLLQTASVAHPATIILGVAVEQRQSARRFLQGANFTYPQLLAPAEPRGLLRRMGNKSGALPYTLVLTPQGEICTRKLGEITAAWIEDVIARCDATPGST
jgi:thiol-disulfide isomerase/thioredoxin